MIIRDTMEIQDSLEFRAPQDFQDIHLTKDTLIILGITNSPVITTIPGISNIPDITNTWIIASIQDITTVMEINSKLANRNIPEVAIIHGERQQNNR